MDDDARGAYLYYRNGTAGGRRSKKRRSHRRAAGVLVTVLLLLSGAICLLVFFLPRLSVGVDARPSGVSAVFYFLSTAEETEKQRAAEQAQSCSSRGGAGYVYNDGVYRIIAGVYASETDAKALASVNDGATYFKVEVAQDRYAQGAMQALEYFAGEWFSAVDTAVRELDRGNITEAAAEHSVEKAFDKLCALLYAADDGNAKTAAARISALATESPTLSVLSRIRYIQVATVAVMCG